MSKVLSRSQSRKSVPSWSLRGRSDIGSFTYDNLKAATPGPASYGTVKTSIYKRNVASAGFTMPGRHNQKDKLLNVNPGPGCYDTGNIGTTSCSKRGMSMGIRHSEFIVPLITNIDRIWTLSNPAVIEWLNDMISINSTWLGTTSLSCFVAVQGRI